MQKQIILLTLLNLVAAMALPATEACAPVTCNNPTSSTAMQSINTCPGNSYGCASQVSGGSGLCFQPPACGTACSSNNDCDSGSRCLDLSGFCGQPTCQKIACAGKSNLQARSKSRKRKNATDKKDPENVNLRVNDQDAPMRQTPPAHPINI